MKSPESHDVAELPNGHVLDGRYEIIEELGVGGMATVYKARQLHVDRLVAIKLLHLEPGLFSDEAARQFRERFIREARATARIQHPNVVTVHDFGLLPPDERPFLAMELLVGHDLEDEIMRHGPLAPERALRLFKGCLAGLAEAHDLGIIHRDLKPTNLFIKSPGTDDESMVIVDFGIASHDDQDIRAQLQGRLTMPGQMLGTPAFLPPEFIRHQTTTPALDVYQMGLLFLEMLSGVQAVNETDPYEVLRAHCEGQLTIPDWIRNSDLWPVLAHALHIDHTQRLANARAFLDALEARADVLDTLVAPTDFETLTRSSTGLTAVARPQLVSEPSFSALEPVHRRRAVPVTAMVVAALALLALGIVAMLVIPDETPDAAAAANLQASDHANDADAAPAPPPQVEAPEPALAHVVIAGTPEDAEVLRGDQRVGTTPLTLELEDGERVEVVVRKDGFVDSQMTFVARDALELAYVLEARPAAPAEPAVAEQIDAPAEPLEAPAATPEPEPEPEPRTSRRKRRRKKSTSRASERETPDAGSGKSLLVIP